MCSSDGKSRFLLEDLNISFYKFVLAVRSMSPNMQSSDCFALLVNTTRSCHISTTFTVSYPVGYVVFTFDSSIC